MDAQLNFNCPKCNTPGSVPAPQGECQLGEKASTAVWVNEKYTCPGCLGKFVTRLMQVKFEGQVWAMMEVQEPKRIIPPPSPRVIDIKRN